MHMRKIFIFLSVIIIICGLISYIAVIKFTEIFSLFTAISPGITPQVSEKVIKYQKISVEAESFSVIYAQVNKNQTATLIPNFSPKLSAKNAKAQHECQTITNAGFYAKDDQPIGSFIIGGQSYGNFLTSRTFNGFVSKSLTNDYFITDSNFDTPSDWTFQTGPLLILNKKSLTLKIQDDESARRTVAATNTDNQIILLMFFDENQTTKGPLLANLPKYVSEADRILDLNITSAVNLDGGTASVFLQDADGIPEISNVGAFLCIAP
jgi:uncharacterized protein YigE (DUF2233 family)